MKPYESVKCDQTLSGGVYRYRTRLEECDSHMSGHLTILPQDMLEEHAKKLEQRKDSVTVLDPALLHWKPSTYPIYT